MTFATEHADAYAEVQEHGAAVTFTKETVTSDPITHESSVVETTVAGVAMRTRGRADRYQALGLIESKAPTLLFVPTTYGERPESGMTCTWEGAVHTVRDVNPLAPDGSDILSRVIVER